ncbi:MAG: glucoamylase family protein [Ferruginibacter sp.]
MKIKTRHYFLATVVLFTAAGTGCKKSSSPPVTQPSALSIKNVFIDGVAATSAASYMNPATATIKILLSNKADKSTVAGAVSVTESGAAASALNITYENNDSTVVLKPQAAFKHLSQFQLLVKTSLKSVNGGTLAGQYSRSIATKIDSSAKFPLLSDNALMDLVQQQTFKYFWDFGHPVSGLARERNNGDNDIVTSGGTGFGIMTIPVAISRSFITRAEGLARMQKIVDFLQTKAVKVKGAFPHWLNGSTGAIVPFSTNDDGADLVETSYLVAGLLTARQYFNGTDPAETALRTDINTLCNAVEWDWFRQGGQNVLYWHYSATKEWAMNMKIQGWNECLITYILAASSVTHSVPAAVYTGGWAGGSGFANGNNYYGYTLPLGTDYGGPLFFSHYSFLGVRPEGLQDSYANYATQTKNHTLIDYNYCIANPRNYYGYSSDCWGLTASDIKNGYNANSPTNDIGVITPTAALSSFPYTPTESMKALKFFYYTLGDKLWKEYGFVDAFSLKDIWFADSYLAIDQGPIVIMIENYRTGLVWNLFTSCPEVKNGMKALGFTAPYL